MLNGTLPAFPVDPNLIINRDAHHTGLTKREHFAVTLLQGCVAGDPEYPLEKQVDYALRLADMLLERLADVQP